MTRSDKITEFLKYASPRLGYIEHCMEKQALSPQLLISAARKAKETGRLGSMKHLKSVAANKKGGLYGEARIRKNVTDRYDKYRKANNYSFDGSNLGTSFHTYMKEKFSGKTYLEELRSKFSKDPKVIDYAKTHNLNTDDMWAAVTARAHSANKGHYLFEGFVPAESTASIKGLSGWTPKRFVTGYDRAARQYKTSRAADYINNEFAKFKADPAVQQRVKALGISAEELFVRSVRNAITANGSSTKVKNALKWLEEMYPKQFKAYLNDSSVKNLANTAAKGGRLDAVGNWVAKHPTAALLGTAGGTGALAGGIGYGMGNSSGQQEGFDAAAQIFAIQQALMQQRLQQANSNLGSRFMNLFGAGALNNLIG